MKDIELFQIALGISSPWFVKSLELDPAAKRLDIHLDFQKGSKFTCPECGAEGRKVHDTTTKTWRHLNFFQYEAYLTARVPRVHCDSCGVHLVPVPWAREGSGFPFLNKGTAFTLEERKVHAKLIVLLIANLLVIHASQYGNDIMGAITLAGTINRRHDFLCIQQTVIFFRRIETNVAILAGHLAMFAEIIQ